MRKLNKIISIILVLCIVFLNVTTSKTVTASSVYKDINSEKTIDIDSDQYSCLKKENEDYIKTIIVSSDRMVITILDKKTQVLKNYIIPNTNVYSDIDLTMLTPFFEYDLNQYNEEKDTPSNKTAISHRYNAKYFKDKHYGYTDKTHMLYFNDGHVSTGKNATSEEVKLSNRFEEESKLSERLIERLIDSAIGSVPQVGPALLAAQIADILNHGGDLVDYIDVLVGIIGTFTPAGAAITTVSFLVDLPLIQSARYNVKQYYNKAKSRW